MTFLNGNSMYMSHITTVVSIINGFNGKRGADGRKVSRYLKGPFTVSVKFSVSISVTLIAM